VAATDAGAYSVKITGPVGTVTSTAATLSVMGFTTNLTAGTISLATGTTKVLTVVATGSPTPTYQWRLNGVAISGATKSTYTASAGTVAASNVYDVVITNSAGSVTSAATTIATCVPATVSSSPVTRSVVAGQSATFSATAAGTGPFTYQWMKAGVAISGATSSTYTIGSVAATDAGAYSVKITGPVGTVTSTAATLTIVTPVVFTVQPSTTSDISISTGVSKVLSVKVTGTGPYTYQWRKDGVVISGATSSSYTIRSSTVASSAKYDVIVSNAVGASVSNTVNVNVCTPVSVSTQPVATSAVVGKSTTLSVVGSGTGPFTYQWMKAGVAISGATSSTYTIASVAATDAGAYSVKITGPVGNVTSTAATLTVVTPPAVTVQPVALSKLQGQSASFSVTATGTATLTYQWFKDGVAITGAKSATYAISSVQSSNAGTYKVLVMNTGGWLYSQEVALVLVTTPVISVQPASFTGDSVQSAGQPVQLSVTASGGSLSYQWYKNGSAISGATASTYTILSISATGATGSYYVKITNVAGSVNSSTAVVTLVNPPVFITQPVSLAKPFGSSATMSVVVNSAAPVNYQWYKDGFAITGATGSSYTISSVSTLDNALYRVSVSNTTFNYYSDSVTLNVGPAITVQPESFYGPIKSKQDMKIVEYTFDGGLQGWVPLSGSNDRGSLSWSYLSTRSPMTLIYRKGDFGYCGVFATGNDSGTPYTLGYVYDGISLKTYDARDFKGQDGVQLESYITIQGVTSDNTVWGTSVSKSFFVKDGKYEYFTLGTDYSSTYIDGANKNIVYGSCFKSGVPKAFLYDTSIEMSVVGGKLNGVTEISIPVANVSWVWVNSSDGTNTYGRYSTYDRASGIGSDYSFYYNGTTCVSSPYVDPLVPLDSTGRKLVLDVDSPMIRDTVYDPLCGNGSKIFPSEMYSGYRNYGYEFKDGRLKLVAIPISPSAGPYSRFRGLQCDNLDGLNASASICSPLIDLRGATSSYCTVQIGSPMSSSGDLSFEVSLDGGSWSTIFISDGSIGTYNFSLAEFDGKKVFIRASMKGDYNLLEILNVKVSGTKYDGEPSKTFTVTALGSGLSYQWYKNGSIINGATADSYTVSDKYATGAEGSYSCRITNAAGYATSSDAVIKIYKVPEISSPPVSISALGPTLRPTIVATYSFTTSADGWTYGSYSGNQSPYHWDWNSANGVIADRLSGSTYASNTDTFAASPVLDLRNISSAYLSFNCYYQLYNDGLDTLYVQASADGINWSNLKSITGSGNTSFGVSLSGYDNMLCLIRFRLVTSSLYNSGGVNIDNINVTGLTPSIPGAPAKFSVSVADSSGCTYQWYKDGVAITGANQSSYSISSVVKNDAGYYSVTVTNPAGSVSSAPVALVVY
jgi:hypothetical protein